MDTPHFAIKPEANFPAGGVECRRADWTAGYAIRLADDRVWHLPRIDGSLLIVRPRLLDELSKAYDLALRVEEIQSDLDVQTMTSALYHAQLAQLGVALLQINYDQPVDRWRCLLAFDELGRMLRMTHEVALAVGESAAAWMPLYRTWGRAGRSNLRLN